MYIFGLSCSNRSGTIYSIVIEFCIEECSHEIIQIYFISKTVVHHCYPIFHCDFLTLIRFCFISVYLGILKKYYFACRILITAKSRDSRTASCWSCSDPVRDFQNFVGPGFLKKLVLVRVGSGYRKMFGRAPVRFQILHFLASLFRSEYLWPAYKALIPIKPTHRRFSKSF